MSRNAEQDRAIERIRENITKHGHHIYVVSGGSEPRFAYTIGLSKRCGAELILAGAILYLYDDVIQIVNKVAAEVGSSQLSTSAHFEMGSLGNFSLRSVDSSWIKSMILGAIDFYQDSEIPALQIIPDQTHWTIDIPDMSKPWSGATEPIWQWLKEPWQFAVSSKSKAITNLAALRGERVTEAMRWEDDEWELFAGAGPDVPKDEMRVVPLGNLLAVDPTLLPVLDLSLESGLWRDDDANWHPWEASA